MAVKRILGLVFLVTALSVGTMTLQAKEGELGPAVQQEQQDVGQVVGDVQQDAGQVVGDVQQDAGQVVGDIQQDAGQVVGDIQQDEVPAGEAYYDENLDDGIQEDEQDEENLNEERIQEERLNEKRAAAEREYEEQLKLIQQSEAENQTQAEPLFDENDVVDEFADDEVLKEVFEASADDIAGGTFKNTTSTGITWRIDKNGKLTVSGKGEMRSYSYKDVPWYDYREKITSAVVQLTGTKDFNSMFYGCKNMKTVDLSKCSMSTAVDLNRMFYNCEKLQAVDVSKWDTSKVTNIEYMFYYCKALKTLDVSKWNTAKIVKMSGCFSSCILLKTLDVSKWNTALVTNMSGCFSNCTALTSLDVSKWNTAKVTSMASMFSYCKSLTKIDVSQWNTSKVKNMYSMFYYCNSVKALNVSKWNTANVTDMSWMFSDCVLLKSLNVSGFNTSKVTKISFMFSNCRSLTSLDVSKFNTAKVTNMEAMFYRCEQLTSLNLSNFNTLLVTDMSQMFYYCKCLKSLNLSSFDTPKLKDAYAMFLGCTQLSSLNISKMKTSAVIDMGAMFRDCSKLTSLDLSKFSTANVKYFSSMFSGCTLLKKLDLSTFNMSKAAQYSYFIDNCESLYEIKTPKNLPKTEKGDTELPDGIWMSGGKKVTALPTGSSTSSVIKKDSCIVKVDYEKKVVKYNTALSLKNPTRTNYEFKGWFTQPNGKGTQVKSGLIITRNLSIYSYWIGASNRSDLVRRMYGYTLRRSADEAGLKHWVDGLNNGTYTGADLAKSFILSEELTKKNLSNDQFIKMMYQAFFGREADLAGYQYWMGLLENGMSRKYILSQFVKADEYVKLCGDCKINMGSYYSDEVRDLNVQLTAYLVRCYTQALERTFDANGLNYWANEILTGRRSAREAAVFFIQSPEFVARNLSNADYIKVLYRTFFGREYDQAGYDYWLGQLNSGAVSRDTALLSFANSNEFTAILTSFGVQ